MHDPKLNYLWADPHRASERHHERLHEAERRRLENLALGRGRASQRRLPARLLQAPGALVLGMLHVLRTSWRALRPTQTANEP